VPRAPRFRSQKLQALGKVDIKMSKLCQDKNAELSKLLRSLAAALEFSPVEVGALVPYFMHLFGDGTFWQNGSISLKSKPVRGLSTLLTWDQGRSYPLA
jgi:hypothetical protein